MATDSYFYGINITEFKTSQFTAIKFYSLLKTETLKPQILGSHPSDKNSVELSHWKDEDTSRYHFKFSTPGLSLMLISALIIIYMRKF
jgi:hypothetical protein